MVEGSSLIEVQLIVSMTSDLGEEDEMFLHSECVKENVVLWTEAEAAANPAQVPQNVIPIHHGRATRGGNEA